MIRKRRGMVDTESARRGGSGDASEKFDRLRASKHQLPARKSKPAVRASMPETLYGKQCRAAPNCAMAVALARLFYMMQGINPMTDSTKPRTLKDQLESETADTERSAAVDSERYHGGDWWQLTDAEESVFVIDPGAVPAHDYRLVMLRGFQEYCLQPVMGGRPYRTGLPATSRLNLAGGP